MKNTLFYIFFVKDHNERKVKWRNFKKNFFKTSKITKSDLTTLKKSACVCFLYAIEFIEPISLHRKIVKYMT